jgi:hypothetical protein
MDLSWCQIVFSLRTLAFQLPYNSKSNIYFFKVVEEINRDFRLSGIHSGLVTSAACLTRGQSFYYSLEIIATREHLLTGGSHDNRVFILCRVTPLGIYQWGVGLHNAQVTQVLEGAHVLFLLGATGRVDKG